MKRHKINRSKDIPIHQLSGYLSAVIPYLQSLADEHPNAFLHLNTSGGYYEDEVTAYISWDDEESDAAYEERKTRNAALKMKRAAAAAKRSELKIEEERQLYYKLQKKYGDQK